jgi:hypothetical protein
MAPWQIGRADSSVEAKARVSSETHVKIPHGKRSIRKMGNSTKGKEKE